MNNNVLGINGPGLDVLYKELELKKEIIAEKLTQIQNAFNKLSDYCIGAQFVSEEFQNNISKVRETIEFNIDSYIQDLRTLQERLNDNDKFIANLFNQAIAEQNMKNSSFDNNELIRDTAKERE